MPVNPAACQGTAMPPGMLLQAVLFLFLLVGLLISIRLLGTLPGH